MQAPVFVPKQASANGATGTEVGSTKLLWPVESLQSTRDTGRASARRCESHRRVRFARRRRQRSVQVRGSDAADVVVDQDALLAGDGSAISIFARSKAQYAMPRKLVAGRRGEDVGGDVVARRATLPISGNRGSRRTSSRSAPTGPSDRSSARPRCRRGTDGRSRDRSRAA